MRIIAGEYRGRILQAPKGLATRPTTNRVREAIMSSIESLAGDIEGLSVLDAFAGSGLFGFELLSRGASYVEAYDIDRKAQEAIRSNASMLKLSKEKYRLIARNVFDAHSQSAKCFDLVVLDPPYKMPVQEVHLLLSDLIAVQRLNEEALIVYEHDRDVSFKNDSTLVEMFAACQIEFVREKKYGDTCITYLFYKGRA